jgi:hypothetical protein
MEHGRFITVIHAFGNLLTELPPPLGDVTEGYMATKGGATASLLIRTDLPRL